MLIQEIFTIKAHKKIATFNLQITFSLPNFIHLYPACRFLYTILVFLSTLIFPAGIREPFCNNSCSELNLESRFLAMLSFPPLLCNGCEL